MPLTSAQQQLVVDNERLAHWLAVRAGRRCTREQVEDLAQTALLAMCRAAQLFDPNGRAPFGSYAGPACVRAIRDEMNERLGLIRLPRHLFRRARADHPYQAHAAQARRVGLLDRENEPSSADDLDDYLDAEAFLAWLLPADRTLLLSWLGGEPICSIAARRGQARQTIRTAVGRILSELRGRASR